MFSSKEIQGWFVLNTYNKVIIQNYWSIHTFTEHLVKNNIKKSSKISCSAFYLQTKADTTNKKYSQDSVQAYVQDDVSSVLMI